MQLNIFTWDVKQSSNDQMLKIEEEVNELRFEVSRYSTLIHDNDCIEREDLKQVVDRIAEESSDVIQAVSNLASMLGIDLSTAMDNCTNRQINRGRIQP